MKSLRIAIRQKIARNLLRIAGWKIKDNFPQEIQKVIMLGGPHTSNWDFLYGLLTSYTLPIPIRFYIKSSFMIFPLNLFFRLLGGIAVQRNKIQKKTQLLLDTIILFQKSERLGLAIFPEGTRSYTTAWQRGFYKIAQEVNIPILLGYIDYNKKETSMEEVFYPTGKVDEDIVTMQKIYEEKNITPKFPEKSFLSNKAQKNS